MKILQINVVYKQGSTGRIVSDLNDLIIQKGWKSYIAYGRDNWNDENSIKIGTKFDMYIHGIGTRFFDRHGLFSKKATVNFIEKIDKLNIDIYHLHNIHGYYLHYPTLFEYLKDKKVIWTLHDCWSFTGHCSHYDYIGCDKWRDICSKCPQKSSYPNSFGLDNSKNNFLLKKEYFGNLKALILITPSYWLLNEVKQSFLSEKTIKVIPNGIDIDIFKPIKSNFRKSYNLENKFIILGVANIWDERKGLNYFIKLSKQIDKDETIVLVGLNKKQLQELPKDIVGIGRTDNLDSLIAIYSTVDIFINATLEDTFPTTNLESLACGTPVVTFRTGGSIESVDKNTGLIVTKGSLEELLVAIKEIKSIGKESFTKTCRERAKNLFDKDNNFEKYLRIYEKLI